MVFFRVKKAWAMPRSVSFKGLIQNFQRAFPTLFTFESPSGPLMGIDNLSNAYPMPGMGEAGKSWLGIDRAIKKIMYYVGFRVFFVLMLMRK